MIRVWLAAFALIVVGATSHAAAPNVLFIAIDDLRPELGCYGVDRIVTPNLDRLAERCVRFDRAYCNIAVCGASRASIMTGLRPTPTRFTRHDTWVKNDAPGVPTLAASFRQAGYHTVTNGKIYHHKGDDPDAWSEPDWRPQGGGQWWALPANRARRADGARGPAYESTDTPVEAYPDYALASKTINDLRRLADKEQPFFIACGFLKPHLPFAAPASFWDQYPSDSVALPKNMSLPQGLDRSFRYNWGELRKYGDIPSAGPLAAEVALEMLRGYYSCVTFVDSQVGRVLDELDRLGIADKTIVVVWGDHGWQLGEHGFWCKHTNFEVATRVPLLIAAPRVATGRASRALVESIDVYPTLCDLAGLPKPDHLQGKSLVRVLEDPEAPHRDFVYTRYGGGDAVRTVRFRYIEMRARRGEGDLQATALFDLEQDPGENVNVGDRPAYAGVTERLRVRLTSARRAAAGVTENEP